MRVCSPVTVTVVILKLRGALSCFNILDARVRADGPRGFARLALNMWPLIACVRSSTESRLRIHLLPLLGSKRLDAIPLALANAYPREVLIEAILVYVEDVLSRSR